MFIFLEIPEKVVPKGPKVAKSSIRPLNRAEKTEITKQRIGSLYSRLDMGLLRKIAVGLQCNSASKKQLISPRPFDKELRARLQGARHGTALAAAGQPTLPHSAPAIVSDVQRSLVTHLPERAGPTVAGIEKVSKQVLTV